MFTPVVGPTASDQKMSPQISWPRFSLPSMVLKTAQAAYRGL